MVATWIPESSFISLATSYAKGEGVQTKVCQHSRTIRSFGRSIAQPSYLTKITIFKKFHKSLALQQQKDMCAVLIFNSAKG